MPRGSVLECGCALPLSIGSARKLHFRVTPSHVCYKQAHLLKA